MNYNVVGHNLADNFLFYILVCMIGRRKAWKLGLLLACVASLSFSYTQAFSFSSSTLNLLVDLDNQKNPSVRKLIESYCTSVLNSSSFIEEQFVYNAKQSAFVHLLCRNFGISSPYFADQETDYFKRRDFNELWFQDITQEDGYQTDYCTPGFFRNDCNLSVNIPKLFNDIMNDYVNMKQPNIYGMTKNFKTDSDIVSQINLFSSGYFDRLEICGNKDPRYPKTCKMMQSTIKNVRNALSDVSILNASGIFALSDAKTNTKMSCGTTWSADIFYCGLYGDRSSRLTSFVNLTYNELFYYRLFVGYYLSMLQRYPSLLKNNTYMTDYSYIQKTFLTQYTRSKDALSLSFRMMRDTYTAFPFHVGFSMYQEDLDGLWTALSHIVRPIYTLDSKLRNVQSQ